MNIYQAAGRPPLPPPATAPTTFLYLLKLCFNIIHYTHLARLQPANSRPGPTFYWKSRQGGAQPSKNGERGFGEHGNTERMDLVTTGAGGNTALNLHSVWRLSIKFIFISSLIFFLGSCRLGGGGCGQAGPGRRGCGWC